MISVAIFLLTLSATQPDNQTANEKIPTLAEVIANIAAHEKNLTDMDAKWTVKYNLLKKDFGYDGAIDHRTSVRTSVVQGQYFRFERKAEGETIAKKENKIHRLFAYDGSKTRSKADGIINVQDSLVNHKTYAFRPHGLLLEEYLWKVPLSVLLKGGDELKNHPDAGDFKTNYHAEASVLGYDTFQDVKCIKLKVKAKALNDSHANIESILWISPKHSYLPIRQQGFSLQTSTTIPTAVGEVITFKELKEGICLPATWKHTVYDPHVIKESGSQKELCTYEGTLDSFDLHPNYPIEFFSQFDYPTGATYYELNAAGKITRSGSIHRDPKTGFFSWSSTTYTIVLLTILLVLFLVYLYRHKIFRFGYT